MINKRGLSDVVSTVLIILIIVAAIGIIGTIVLRNVGDTGSKVESATLCLELDVEPTRCVSNATASVATISRGAGGSATVITNLSLVYENAAGATTLANFVAIPSALNAGSQTNSAIVNQAKLSVAAKIRGSDGNEYQCDTTPAKIDCTAS